MKILLTADWHLDKGNRLDDFTKSITSMVDYAIAHNIPKFFILGDLYRDWHASPVEKEIVHKLLVRLSRAKIDVYIVLGNHDVDDKNFQHGLTAAQEIDTLKVSNVRVIAEPEIIAVAGRNILALPHLSRRFLEAERKKQGKDVTYIGVIKKHLQNDLTLVVGHMLIAEAVKGGSDIGMESARAVSLKELTDGISIPMVFGDIHLPQRVCDTPSIQYVGSPDRINFGEATEAKRFLIYDIVSGSQESIPLATRSFLDIKVDLEGGAIQLSGSTSGDIPLGPEHPMDSLRAFFNVVAPQVEAAVVKLTVSGHKDSIDKLVKHEIAALLQAMKPYLIKAVTFIVTDNTSIRDTTYSAIPTDAAAFAYWVDSRGYDPVFKEKVLTAGRDLLTAK